MNKHCILSFYMDFKLFSCCAASLFACFLVGCQTEQPAQTVDIAPLSTQIGNLSDANADLKVANERLKAANNALTAENARLLAMLRADAEAGQSANLKGWLPFEKYVWGHQIALLPDIVPDKTTADRWNEASTLYAEGGESAMQGVLNTLNADAKKTNETLGQLLSQTKQLTKERDAANEAATAALARVHEAEEDLSAAVEKARQDEAQAIRLEQVKFCNRWGGFAALAALAAGISAYWLGTIGLVLFGGLGLSSLILFGAARFLSSPWFGWTAGAVVIGAVIASIVLVLRKQRQADDAAKLGMAVKPIISALDTAYDAADIEHQAWMDAQIFEVLGKQGAEYSAAIHEIKASIALEKSGDVK